jgi:hypothetical protein
LLKPPLMSSLKVLTDSTSLNSAQAGLIPLSDEAPGPLQSSVMESAMRYLPEVDACRLNAP